MRSNMAGGLGLCSALLVLAAGARAQDAPASPAPTTAAPGAATPQSASLTLGGDVVLTLRASAGGMTPQQRVDAIDARISDLLGIPNIKPSDVSVYTPTGKPPVIYALGRHLITVDAATAKSEGEGLKPLVLAEVWAKKLQQVLPRVNYRPSNQPEPVIPPHPPLNVTADLSKVGGNVGYVSLRNKVVFKITGPQEGGLTAQERAVLLSQRLQVAVNKIPNISDSDISVAPVAAVKAPLKVKPAATSVKKGQAAPSAVNDQEEISVGTTPIITVDSQQAKSAGYKSAAVLAAVWAKNVRTALSLTAPSAPVATPPAAAPATPPAAAPATAGGG